MSIVENSESLQLEYRPQVKKFFFYLLGFCLFSILILFRIEYGKIGNEDWYKGLFKMILAASVPITIIVKLIFVFRPKIFTKYRIFNDKIEVLRGRSSNELYFKDIDRIRFSWFSPRFFGGFALHFRSGQLLKFPSLVENCSELIQKVAHARADLVSEEKLKEYILLNEVVGISWTRVKERFLLWQVWVSKLVLFPLLLSYVVSLYKWDFSTSYLVIFPMAYVFAILINLVEERIWMAQMKKSHLIRSASFEKKLFVSSSFLYLLLTSFVTYLILVI